MRSPYFRNISQRAFGGILYVLTALLVIVATLPAHAQTGAVLYNFCSLVKCVDGQNPVGHIVGDSAGNIYGTTSLGGRFGQGVLYKVNPSGVETILHEFGGTTNDGKQPNGVYADNKGNLYGTTTYGGSHVVGGVGLGTLFKMTPAGSYSILYNFGANSADAQYPSGGPAIGASGNLYGVTIYGGTNGMGTVFKLTPAGQEMILHNFGDNSDDGYDATDLIVGPHGDLYGTTFGGGVRNAGGTIFEVSTSDAYSIRFNFDCNAPPSRDAGDPISLSFDAKGNLYGTAFLVGNNDWGGVFKLSRGGKDWVETIPITFSASPEGYVPESPVIFDQAGNMYGTTSAGGATGYGTVWERTASGEFTPLLNFDTTVGYSPDGSLLLDASGNLYGTTYFGGSGNTTTGGGTLFKIVR